MTTTPSKAEFRERLVRLDTSVVSDALDRLGLTGVVTGIHRLSTDRAIAGRVLTVKLERPNGRVPDRHNCTAAIEAAEPGDVIVIEPDVRRRPCNGRCALSLGNGMLDEPARCRFVNGERS